VKVRAVGLDLGFSGEVDLVKGALGILGDSVLVELDTDLYVVKFLLQLLQLGAQPLLEAGQVGVYTNTDAANDAKPSHAYSLTSTLLLPLHRCTVEVCNSALLLGLLLRAREGINLRLLLEVASSNRVAVDRVVNGGKGVPVATPAKELVTTRRKSGSTRSVRQTSDHRYNKNGGRPITVDHLHEINASLQQVGVKSLPPLVDQFSESEASPIWVASVYCSSTVASSVTSSPTASRRTLACSGVCATISTVLRRRFRTTSSSSFASSPSSASWSFDSFLRSALLRRRACRRVTPRSSITRSPHFF